MVRCTRKREALLPFLLGASSMQWKVWMQNRSISSSAKNMKNINKTKPKMKKKTKKNNSCKTTAVSFLQCRRFHHLLISLFFYCWPLTQTKDLAGGCWPSHTGSIRDTSWAIKGNRVNKDSQEENTFLLFILLLPPPFSWFISLPTCPRFSNFFKCPTANWVAVVVAGGGASGEGAESQGRWLGRWIGSASLLSRSLLGFSRPRFFFYPSATFFATLAG